MIQSRANKYSSDRRHRLVVIFLLASRLQACTNPEDGATARSVSPNGKYCIILAEHKGRNIDRNFDVLVSEQGSKWKVIFTSPDEGSPPGTERFLWSSDSRYVLLVGRNFFVVKKGESLESGELLYLLLDVQTGKIKCNARQDESYPRFEIPDVSRLTWASEKPK